MKGGLKWLSLVGLCSLGLAQAAEKGLDFSISTINYNEPAPVYCAIADFCEKDAKGELAFTFTKVRWGLKTGDFFVNYLYRQDSVYQFSDDTADAFFRYKNDIPFEEGRTYEIDLTAHSFSGRGFEFGFRTQEGPWSGGVSLSYFKARDLYDGTVQGEATQTFQNAYDFRVDVDYYYEDDVLFGRKAKAAEGDGFSLDANLGYAFTPAMRLVLNITDLFGRIYWKNAPHTMLAARDGNILELLLAGLETYVTETQEEDYRSFTQRLFTKYHLKLEHQLDKRNSLWLDYTDFGIKNLMALGLKKHFGESDASLLIMPFDNASAFSFQHLGYRFSLMADRFNPQQAHLFGLSFSKVWML